MKIAFSHETNTQTHPYKTVNTESCEWEHWEVNRIPEWQDEYLCYEPPHISITHARIVLSKKKKIEKKRRTTKAKKKTILMKSVFFSSSLVFIQKKNNRCTTMTTTHTVMNKNVDTLLKDLFICLIYHTHFNMILVVIARRLTNRVFHQDVLFWVTRS